MLDPVTVDFETRSEADLKKVGSWAYSEHPTTEIICMTWGFQNRPRGRWWPDHPDFGGAHYPRPNCEEDLETGMPLELRQLIEAGHPIEAHKADFEWSLWQNVCVKKLGWISFPLSQLQDTMAVASYYCMPPGLDKLTKALGYPGKDPEGTRLITKYSKLHLKTAKRQIPPEDMDKWVNYCDFDTALEQSVSDELGPLPERELPVYKLDKIINMRGLYLDIEGIEAAASIADQRAEALTEEFKKIVGSKPSQHKKVLSWFRANKLMLDDLQAETLEELVDPENEQALPQGPVRRAVEIRLAINKASTKKLYAMARQRGRDGRARFQTRYHGAGTGRNTASGFQVLNMSRGFEQVKLKDGSRWPTPDDLVRDIMRRDAAWLDLIYGDAMDALGKATRHWIMAQPGRKIMSGDYVSVEAVILACLFGEDWKIEAFRRGAKIYEMMADKIYGLPPGTVTKETHPAERQDGKIGELAFGYQGALNAWLGFDSSGRHTDERIIEICRAWRAEHPATTRGWRALESAAIEAVRFPGRVTGYREIGFEVVDEWLTMILPDGKRLWYRDPELRMGMPSWHKPLEDDDCAAGTCDCKPQPKLTYMAWKFGQWRRVPTYGGKLTENAVQATSRQILVPAALALERYGYSVILTVYDEVVSEVPRSFGSTEEFCEIMMGAMPDFASSWPISVDAWEGERYRK